MDTSSRCSSSSLVPTDSTRRPARPISLVGFMATGKSTVGRLLAERLELPFVDSDAEIERAFGMSVAEIFRTSGEAAFREAENCVIARLLEGEGKVVAVGGGAFVDPETRDMLNRSARTIWLDPDFDLIADRLARSTSRPLASSRSPDDLRRLWEQRRPCYAEAHIRITPSDGDPRDSVEEIVRLLEL